MAHPELADRFGNNILANPVGLSCILRSADGRLLLGRRSDTVAYYPGRVHPFAGSLEPGEGMMPPQVFSEMRRELSEELSIDASDMKDLCCIGLAEDVSLRQPELMFSARCHLSLSQIERQLDASEHHALWSVQDEASAVAEALGSTALLTPVAVAALLLWGKAAYGSGWFNAHSVVFLDGGTR
jgi:8-oxo-dGTP pyrophosphatase MutT (NUDIX family)